MALLDLFRPKWKHSDPEVRAEAVRQFGASDAALLTQVLRGDRDARVRRVALKKIDDPRVLQAAAADDPDEALRKAAADKAAELLMAAALGQDDKRAADALELLRTDKEIAAVARRAALGQVRDQALSRLADPRLLADVARTADDADVRRRAAERVSEPEALRDLAIQAPDKDVALSAVNRLGDAALLEDVSRRGKNKAVRGIAKEKLDSAQRSAAPSIDGRAGADGSQNGNKNGTANGAAAGAAGQGGGSAGRAPGHGRGQGYQRRGRSVDREPSPEAQRKAQVQRLCRLVEAAAQTQDPAGFDQAAQDIAEARAEWAELHVPPGDEAQRRFDRAVTQFESRLEEVRRLWRAKAEDDARKARREQEQHQQRELLAGRQALCEKIEALDKPGDKQADKPDGDDPMAIIEEARAAWLRLPPLPPDVKGELERRFARACDAVVRRHRQAADLKVARARLWAICLEAEALPAGDDRLREADSRFARLEREWRDLFHALPGSDAGGDDMQRRFSAVRERIAAQQKGEQQRRQQDEVRILGALEAFCADMEAAATPKDDKDDKKRVERIAKQVPLASRDLGRVPREQQAALRARFTAAQKALNARLQEIRSADEWQRWANVPILEKLCGWMDALREAAAQDGVDMGLVAKELRGLQKEWRAVGPAPKDKSAALWQRFKEGADELHARCQVHFAALDEERARNLVKKQDLCQQAEALAGAGSIDWKDTADKIKKLQEEWKAVGPVPKADGDALWKRFRGACDRFFEKRKAHFAQSDEERQANWRKKEALCEKVDGLEADDQKGAVELIRGLMAEWKAVGPVPRDKSDEIWTRFRAGCDRLVERSHVAMPGEDIGKDGSRFENRLPLQALLERPPEPQDPQEEGPRDKQRAGADRPEGDPSQGDAGRQPAVGGGDTGDKTPKPVALPDNFDAGWTVPDPEAS